MDPRQGHAALVPAEEALGERDRRHLALLAASQGVLAALALAAATVAAAPPSARLLALLLGGLALRVAADLGRRRRPILCRAVALLEVGCVPVIGLCLAVATARVLARPDVRRAFAGEVVPLVRTPATAQ